MSKDTNGATIKRAIDARIQHLRERTDLVRSKEKAASATVDGGLQCRLSADGVTVATTDMPGAYGGSAAAPTPGWYLRAALAACDATTIAMRAACVGAVLDGVEVTVESESDPRGIIGMTDGVPAGPLQLVTHIRVRPGDTDPATVREIVAWALAHSPVADAMARRVPNQVNVEIG